MQVKSPALNESPAPTRSTTSPAINLDSIPFGPASLPSGQTCFSYAPSLTVTPPEPPGEEIKKVYIVLVLVKPPPVAPRRQCILNELCLVARCEEYVNFRQQRLEQPVLIHSLPGLD